MRALTIWAASTLFACLIFGCAAPKAVLTPAAPIKKNGPAVVFMGDEPNLGIYVCGYHPPEDKSVLFCLDYKTWQKRLEEETKRSAVPMMAAQ